MQSDHAPVPPRPLMWRATRQHLVVVLVCLAAGLMVGWYLGAAQPTTYSSTANVLVNPTVGNPFTPTPASVRQDEATSLETEARVARSAAVLGKVAVDDAALTLADLQRRATITVPANTQVLELTFTSTDPELPRQVVNAWAKAYLANRDQRSGEINAARIARVESQTQTVVDDLRAATVAAQAGSGANRLFQTELASALRNQLVSLRAQRSYLETSVTPSGSVISPASRTVSTDGMMPLLLLVGGALGGLVLGCLIASVRERTAGVVRSATEVEATGLPVLAAVPAHRPGDRLRRTRGRERHDATIRRVRAKVLDLQPTPQVIAVAPPGSGAPDAPVTEALAESFARAGLRVALIRTDEASDGSSNYGVEVAKRGLSEALLHERLNVLELLQPSVDPLLSLLPWGSSPQGRELLMADRLRAALRPLVDAGHIVVVQSPGLDSAEGEAVVGAADLGLVVVRTGRTRLRDLAQVARHPDLMAKLGALVVDPRMASRRGRRPTEDVELVSDAKEPDRTRTSRTPR